MNFPFIPDLDKLFEVYSEVLNSDYESEMDSNPYFWFLRDRCFISVSDGRVISSGSFNLSDPDKNRDVFRQFLYSQPVVRKILDQLESQHLYPENVAETLSELYEHSEVLVFLSWMESLNLIANDETGYKMSDDSSDAEDMEIGDSIYPLSYSDKPLDISEEKFSVFEYLRKLKRGDVKMDPEFQRKLVWKNEQKSRFIESLILLYPIPPLYLKRDGSGKLLVIDGLQRTTALAEFTSNKFSLSDLNALKDLNGKTFKDLQDDPATSHLATRIEDKQLGCYVLGPSLKMRVVYDIFNRINTGGTKLERQEVRNCVFIGKSTRLLKSISEESVFKRAIANGISPKRMKDREAALRCIAFALTPYEEYEGSLDDLLEKTMKRLNAMSDQEITSIKERALDIFNLTYEIFGDRNFRIPSGQTRGRINIALMEAVFNCFWNRSADMISDHSILRSRFQQMITDKTFLESFRSSTGSKPGVRIRFSTAHQYLDHDTESLNL